VEEPEDEIVKMATDREEKAEDLIASEIMNSIGMDEIKPSHAEIDIAPEEIPQPEREEMKAVPIIKEETIPEKSRPVETMLGADELQAEETSSQMPEPPEVANSPAAITKEKLIDELTSEVPGAIVDDMVQESLPEEPEALPQKDDIIDSEVDKILSLFAETFEIKQSAAKELYSNGYRTIESLMNASEENLREIKGIGKVTARRIVHRNTKDETKMCSLCNAIVPVQSRICSRCGVKFVTAEDKSAKDSVESPAPPTNAALLHSKIFALMNSGKNEEALRIINEALDNSPNDAELLKFKSEIERSSESISSKKEKNGIEAEKTPASKEDDMLARMVERMESSSKFDADIAAVEKAPPASEPAQSSAPAIAHLAVKEDSDEDIKLKTSFTYLILEERSARSYRLFKMNIKEGMPGYCVTRTFPEKIKERYELGDVPVLWLSNVAKEEAVRPKDLEKLSLSLEEFLAKAGGIILLDGIEYLITNNNFITVLKLIQSLRDQVAINRSILLLSINPSTMDNHQINLLKREVDTVIE